MVVEGFDDLFSVVGLMRVHVVWPQDKNEAPVYIRVGNGAEEILKDGFLSALLKTAVIKTLGVMLDGDTSPRGRYQRIHALCSPLFPAMPADLPKDGLVVDNAEQKRFGVWIMPDNIAEGCLETFLRVLVPNPSEHIWQHAVKFVRTAKGIGCACRDHHIDKANLYAWLALQDPPSQSPGEAITKKVLDPSSPGAAVFVKWFRRLYRL